MVVRIDIYSDGILLGFTYYAAENTDDYNEFNFYLFITRITIQW
jgi:hypothetical protein